MSIRPDLIDMVRQVPVYLDKFMHAARPYLYSEGS